MRCPVLSLIGCLAGTSPSAQVGPNIDDLAKELSNPGAANATMNFKLEYRSFDGTLAGADDQNSTTLTFQPVLPFILPNGNNLIFRPAFSYVWDQPSVSSGGISTRNSWGDIPYDLLYSWSGEGWTFGAGVVGSIPTGSAASSDNWLLGPSALAVRTTDWGVWGVFPFHNEKVGGNGPDMSLSSLQYFLFYSLGEGWLIGTGPTMSYDWNAPSGDAWTVPLQLSLSKTAAIGKQLVKLNFSADYNMVRPDAFAEEWTYTFTVSPVVKNPFQRTPPEPVDAVTRAAVLAPIR
ncbi:hypothetical protein [Shimia sagamensis]|uniref:Transporter n=1 Tax=Shimia sagamensis TaxID=1566352 RepID=A0ABY1P464_9RHOB|nr:hypothetical protein [Shimia sagamensis]SMP24791.1 hypothetical protein SAMN06265373_1053 [Shimia sagamensis]